jgi:dienelactone hydrolase
MSMSINIAPFLKYFLYAFSAAAIATTCFVSYLLWAQPPFYFPRPTGPYSIGFKTYHWIDTKRKELYATDPAHPNRELMVKIWYPASPRLRRTSPTQEPLPEKPTTPYAPYCIHYYKQNQPSLWLLALSRPMYVYAKSDLPIASEYSPFPVILFSPGFRGFQDANTAQCEELASRGYVVVGMTHPYDNSVVQFPDGRIANGLKSIAQRSKGVVLERSTVIDDSATIWLADTEFVLNQLDQLAHNKNSFFYQRLDFNHIGMFGHSMGGSTALQMAARDRRIKAAVNLDGALFGYTIPHIIGKPCMVLLAGNGVIFNKRPLTQKEWAAYGIHSWQEEVKLKATYLPALDRLAQSASHDFYTFVIQNAGHLDLSDMALSKAALPLVRLIATINSSLLRLGIIDGIRVTEIVNTYLVNFFDKYLKGQPSALLDGRGKKYPEVEKMKWVK